MCGGVKYQHGGQAIAAYFPNPAAELPVLLKSGDHGEFIPAMDNQLSLLKPEGGQTFACRQFSIPLI